MAAGEVYRASVQGTYLGAEVAICTWHFRMITGADPTDTIGLYLKTYWTDLIKTKQCSDFRWDQINFLLVNASPPKASIYTTAYPTVGTGGSNALPHQVAVVVTHKTAFAGRSYRGRHYLPAIDQGQFVDGLLAAATRNAIQTYYDDIVAAVGENGTNADIQWVVWSQKLLTYTPVNGTIVREIPGVIRRRRVGVGQ